MKLKINENEIELKHTLRSLILYENVTGQTFAAPQTIQDIITYFYCVVVGSSKDYSLSFDEFVDVLDEQPNLINEFTQWIQDQAKINEDVKKKSKTKVKTEKK